MTRNEKNKATLDKLDGIEFVAFRQLKAIFPYSPRFSTESMETMSELKSFDGAEIAQWLKEIFDAQGLGNKLLIWWSDLSTSRAKGGKPDWIEVYIDDTYAWIKPIWELGYGFFIISGDLDLYWEVFYNEDSTKLLVGKLIKAK